MSRNHFLTFIPPIIYMKDHCVLQRVAFSLNFWFITSDMTMQWEKQKQLRFCWNVSKDIRSCVKLEIKTRIDQISFRCVILSHLRRYYSTGTSRAAQSYANVCVCKWLYSFYLTDVYVDLEKANLSQQGICLH